MKPDNNISEVFVIRGYCNWKDTSGNKSRFASHECCSVHKKTVEVVEVLPRTTRDIGKHIDNIRPTFQG